GIWPMMPRAGPSRSPERSDVSREVAHPARPERRAQPGVEGPPRTSAARAERSDVSHGVSHPLAPTAATSVTELAIPLAPTVLHLGGRVAICAASCDAVSCF